MKRSFFGRLAVFLFLLIVFTGFGLSHMACSKKKSNVEKITAALANRLTESLSFSGDVELKEGNPPSSSNSPDAPQITKIDAPTRFSASSPFQIVLKTDYRYPSEIDFTIIHVENASKYILVKQPFSKVKRLLRSKTFADILDSSTRLTGSIGDNEDIKELDFVLFFALRNKDGQIGDYRPSDFKIPEDPPDCTDENCCNAGFWVEAGSSCTSGTDESDCTEDKCNAEHVCQSIPVVDGTLCNAGFGVDSGECIEGICEEIANYLPNLLAEALEYQTEGAVKQGEPPETSTEDNLPNISEIILPDELRVGSDFKVILKTDYEATEELAKVIVHVVGSDQYIEFASNLTTVDGVSVITLAGLMNLTLELKGMEFQLSFALQTTQGVTGTYKTVKIVIPEEEPECGIGACCNGGSWVADGDPCLTADGEYCTIDTCDANHKCVYNARPDETSCNDGNDETVGDRCVNGMCAGSECNCSGENTCCDGCKSINEGNTCDDGDLCTENDTCRSGACRSGSDVECPTPENPCLDAGYCQPENGECTYPEPKADGSTCALSDEESGLCENGTCIRPPALRVELTWETTDATSEAGFDLYLVRKRSRGTFGLSPKPVSDPEPISCGICKDTEEACTSDSDCATDSVCLPSATICLEHASFCRAVNELNPDGEPLVTSLGYRCVQPDDGIDDTCWIGNPEPTWGETEANPVFSFTSTATTGREIIEITKPTNDDAYRVVVARRQIANESQPVEAKLAFYVDGVAHQYISANDQTATDGPLVQAISTNGSYWKATDIVWSVMEIRQIPVHDEEAGLSEEPFANPFLLSDSTYAVLNPNDCDQLRSIWCDSSEDFVNEEETASCNDLYFNDVTWCVCEPSCAENASCVEGECVCDEGFSGNPYESCTEISGGDEDSGDVEITPTLCRNDNDCSPEQRCGKPLYECVSQECPENLDSTCQALYPDSDYQIQCDENQMCAPEKCTENSWCDTGYVCVSGQCRQPDDPASITSIEINEPGEFLPLGVTRKLSFTAYDSAGNPLALSDSFAVNWSSTQPTQLSVTPQGEITALAAGNEIEISISVPERQELTDTVPFSVLSRSGETAELVVVNASTGDVIETATVLQGTEPCTYSSTSHSYVCSSTCAAVPCNFHVFHSEYEYVSIFQTSSEFVHIPLTPNENLGEVSGVQGKMDITSLPQVLLNEDMLTTQSGFALNGNWMNRGFRNFLSESVNTHLEIGSFINQHLDFSSGAELEIGTYSTRTKFQIVTPFQSNGSASIWGFGGRMPLLDVINIITPNISNELDLHTLLINIEPLFWENLWHAATGLPTENHSKQWDDFSQINYLDDLSEFETLSNGASLQAVMPLTGEADLEFGSMPYLPTETEEEACSQIALTLVAAQHPKYGLVPLGFGVGPDDDSLCGDGASFHQIVRFAPQHGNLYGFPYVLITLATFNDSTDILGTEDWYTFGLFDFASTFFNVLALHSAASFTVQRSQTIPSGILSTPEFAPSVTNATYDDETKAFGASTDSEATFARVTFSNEYDQFTSFWQKRRWTVYSPASDQIAFNLPQNLDGVDYTRISKIEAGTARLKDGTTSLTYNDVFNFNGTDLANINSLLESFSSTPLPINTCANVSCGQEAYCDQETGECVCYNSDWGGNPYDYCYDLCVFVECVNNASCFRGECSCDAGYEGDPETECLPREDFVATIIDFGSGTPVPSMRVNILEHLGEEFGFEEPIVADENGKVVISYPVYTDELYPFLADFLVYGDSTSVDTYQFSYPSLSDDSTLYSVSQITYQTALITAGGEIESNTNHVFGMLLWEDSEGEEQPVGCATISITSANGNSGSEAVRYFGDNGLPTTLANQSSINANHGGFLIGNVQPGEATIQVMTYDNEIYSLDILARSDAATVAHIVLPHGQFSENPGPCSGGVTCQTGYVWAEGECRIAGFSGECLENCTNEDCIDNSGMCTQDNGECMPVYCRSHDDCADLWRCDGPDTWPGWFGCDYVTRKCYRGVGPDPDFCEDYDGGHYCCQNDDPCGWGQNGICDCETTCEWDISDCTDYCQGVTCAAHAHCEIIDYDGVCVCNNGFTGDGATLCEPEHDCNETGFECTVENSYCTTEGYCECNESYEGDAYDQCKPNPCFEVQCGENATCNEGICYCNDGFEGDASTLCTLMLLYCDEEDECPTGYPCHDIEHRCRETECDTTTECENRYPVLEPGDAAMECGEDNLCYPRPCRSDGECTSGFTCMAARCVKTAEVVQVFYLEILNGSSPLPVGASIQLHAAAYDEGDKILPFDASQFEWSTTNTNGSVTADGLFTTVSEGSVSVEVSVSGTVERSATATFRIVGNATADTVRVQVIEEHTGEIISDAHVYQGETQLTYDGQSAYTGAACPQYTCDYHIFHPDYAHVSIMKTTAEDLLIPLEPNQKLGQVEGLRGNIDMSAYPEVLRGQDVFFTQSAFAMNGNLMNHDFGSILGELVDTPIHLGSLISDDLPVSSGYVGGLANSNFREEFDIVGKPSSFPRYAWTLGGYTDLSSVIDIISSDESEGNPAYMFSALHQLLDGTLWHGTSVSSDLSEVSGSWDTENNNQPLYFGSLPERSMAVTEPTSQRISVQVPAQSSIPTLESSLCPDVLLSVVTANRFGYGQIPLGYSISQLETGCTSGRTLDIGYAPQHDGMDDFPYNIIVMALNLNEALADESIDTLYYYLFFEPAFMYYYFPLVTSFGSMSVYRVQAGEMPPPSLDAPPASKYVANAVWNPSTLQFTAEGVPGESLTRVTFSKDFDAYTSVWERKRWIVYYPNSLTVDFTLPTGLEGSESTRLYSLEDNAIEAQSARMTLENSGALIGYDALLEFNQTNLDRVNQWLESTSYFPVVQDEYVDPCESVSCGTNAHCVEGHCVCDTGYEGDPTTECTAVVLHDFSATLINASGSNVSNIPVQIYSTATGTELTSEPLISDAEGKIYFDYAEQQSGTIDILASGNDMYRNSSTYSLDPYSQNVELLLYETSTVSALYSMLGVTSEEGTSMVIGQLFWTDSQGEKEPIACAKITTNDMTGTEDSGYLARVRYADESSNLVSLEQQDSTSTAALFIIFNVPAGETTFNVWISGEILTSFTLRIIGDSTAFTPFILPYEQFSTNPSTCTPSCQDGQVFADDDCRTIGFSSCQAGCSNVNCPGTYEMCTVDNGECQPVYCTADTDCYNLWQCDGEETVSTQWFGCDTSVNKCLRGGGESPDFCTGYTGSHYCCQAHNPCGWAENGTCDCEDTCSWEAGECGLTR